MLNQEIYFLRSFLPTIDTNLIPMKTLIELGAYISNFPKIQLTSQLINESAIKKFLLEAEGVDF